MLRERATAKRELTGAIVSKSKFCRKAIEDKSSDDNDDLSSEDDTQGSKTIDFHVGKFHISVDCNTCVVILPEKFKLWSGDEENTVNHGSEKMDKKEC
ncbi:GPI-anchored wall transfer protein [Dorcoceras hygrometricum]|uniref:GPI-anchored wall transfer protein n=1 Tax=Dorcoceras hygrometricum TaxID=472368 RepID=A0A2Z7BYL3_9LAMI|nr:GPI-anchored wall transfer protein [Dorcoceras hygrometricum]